MSSSCPIFRRDIHKLLADSFNQVNHLPSIIASIRAQVSLTALTSEAGGRGWTLSRVIEALLIEVTKTRARVAELEKMR